MKIVGLCGSIVGSKTKTALDITMKTFTDLYPEAEGTIINLAEYDVQFSDGRHYMDYDGDTKTVVQTIMDADALIIATPIFQASIPAPLKNVFDLLPQDAFLDKVVSILVTAGSPKHYLVIEHQLKPILAYMKAQMIQTYVYVEEKDFYQKDIINDDVHYRIRRLVEDTALLTETYIKMREQKDAEYDF